MAAHHNLGAQFNTTTHPAYRAPYHDELKAAADDARNYAERDYEAEADAREYEDYTDYDDD